MPDRISRSGKSSRQQSLVPLSERQDEIVAHAIRVLGKVRHGESLSRAARSEHIKPATVKKHLPRQFRQDAPGKQWKPTKYDRLTVPMNVLTPQGPTMVPVRGSRQRNILGRYNVALRKWREGKVGAEAELAKFKGETVGGFALITDVAQLSKLEEADAISFEELYAALARVV